MQAQPHIDSWYAASAKQQLAFPPLAGAQSADVCIIGGGYTGLSTAIHLRKRGYSVILLEANKLGWGASGRNGGHVGTDDALLLEQDIGEHDEVGIHRVGRVHLHRWALEAGGLLQ